MRTKSLLLVEDDAALGSVLEAKFKARGYCVVWSSTFASAKDAIGAQPYDLVVLDLLLRDESSLPLIEMLVEQNAQVDILILTGFASIATAVEAIKLGAKDYLPKPAKVDDILTALGEVSAEANAEQDYEPLSPKRLEWEHIQRSLLRNDGNVSATARELKMHRRTLQRKLQKKPVF